MRKIALLAAAAGLAVSGSLAQAGLVISSTRTPGATTDTVSFFVKDDGSTSGSTQKLTLAEVAMVAPSHGLEVGVSSSGPGGVNKTTDVFGTGTNFAYSYINLTSPLFPGFPGFDDQGNATQTQLPQVLSNGTAKAPSPSPVTTSGSLVDGIAGTVYTPASGSDWIVDSTPVQFAQAVVPHGDPVEILAPTSNRSDATFDPTGTGFGDFSTIFTPMSVAYTDGASSVPEPASVGLLGLAIGGMFVRRRRA